MQSLFRKSVLAKCPTRIHHTRRQPAVSTRSGLRDEVAQLNTGKSPVEELSGETNTMVTDVMDIDRTPELLAWLFSGIFGRAKQSASPPATTDQLQPSASNSSTPPLSWNSTGLSVVPDTTSLPATTSCEAVVGNAASARTTAASTSPRSTTGAPASPTIEIATVGGGCFWCIEACFLELQGVLSVVSGYAGGHVPNPTYQQVCSKSTGHAEVVQIRYDSSVLSYKNLLQVFMAIHDPTTPNRSGNDVGPQYRSIILTHDERQAAVAAEVLAEANRALWFGRKVCTEVAPLREFYTAESYHQRYYSCNPGAGYCVFVVRPKLQEFRRKFFKRLKASQEDAAIPTA